MRLVPLVLFALLPLSACEVVSTGDNPEVMYEGRYWRLSPLEERVVSSCDGPGDAILEVDKFYELEAHTLVEGDDTSWWVSAGVYGVREVGDGAVAFDPVVYASADGRDFVDAARWEAYLGEGPWPMTLGLDSDGAFVDENAWASDPDQRFHAESVTVDRSGGCVRILIKGIARNVVDVTVVDGDEVAEEAPFATELTLAPVHPEAVDGTIYSTPGDAE